MDPSFESLYPSPSHDPPRRNRSPRILDSIRGLVHRPTSATPSSRRPGITQRGRSSQDASRPQSWETSVKQALWKRRGQTPGMDDYLTLAQLENAWHKQDSYVGCVCAPQKISQYTYQEAVEAPLMAKHQPGARRLQAPRLAPDLNNPLPPLPAQDDIVIDGIIHPALRSMPYHDDQSSDNRCAVTVPTTNWTYGRGS